MRVAFLGLRGFPNIQGGVETHAENLCPLLVELGCAVEVMVRAAYHPIEVTSWRGVTFKRIWCPKSKGLETIIHTFLGVLYAGFISRPDVLHIQAIGPALITPLARLMGLKVVVTHHGPDYDRQKWGRFAKFALRLGERFGMRWSNARIAISTVIANIVKQSYSRECHIIPNGVVLPVIPTAVDTINLFGLEPGKYVVLVSRLVPEKRHIDLIDAFNKAKLPGWKLAIVGASDHPDAYVLDVLAKAKKSAGIVCTGLQTGNALCELYGHAGLFVLPSSHEGLPIALLEALSYGLPVIASDIPANLEVGLSQSHYFALGNTDALAAKLCELSSQPISKEERIRRREWVSSRFEWSEIARKTLEVYKTALK